MELQQITGLFGAEVVGLDLSGPLGDRVYAQLDEAIPEYKVLVFRVTDSDYPRVMPRVQLVGTERPR